MPTHYHGTPEQELALNTFVKLARATESLMTRLGHHQRQLLRLHPDQSEGLGSKLERCGSTQKLLDS